MAVTRTAALLALLAAPIRGEGKGKGQGPASVELEAEGFVDGHLEGAPPLSGIVCVNWGVMQECMEFERGPDPDTSTSERGGTRESGHQLTVPAQHLATATWTAYMCGPSQTFPSHSLDVCDTSGGTCNTKVLSTGQPCTNVPFVNPDGSVNRGMMLCQSDCFEPSSVVHRLNVNFNTRLPGMGATDENPDGGRATRVRL